jgi:hypothetical protein
MGDTREVATELSDLECGVPKEIHGKCIAFVRLEIYWIISLIQCHHMSLMDFVVSLLVVAEV